MAKFNIGTFVDQAENAEDSGGGGNFERWDPPEGWRGRCKVVKVNGSVSDKDEPRWGIWVEVIDAGDDKGKRFWVNANFSNAWDFITKRGIEVLQGFGVSLTLLRQAGDNIDLVSSALEDKVGIVTARWGKNKNNPDKPFANHTVAAIKSGAPPKRSDEDHEDEIEDEIEEPEEELEEEPEPEPPAKTKARPKAKPKAKAAEPEPDEDGWDED